MWGFLFSLRVSLTSLLCLLPFSLQMDTEVAPSPACICSISIGGSSACLCATYSLSSWMLPDLRDSANLRHGEALWTMWKGSRYTCNFTSVLCLIGALVHNDSEFCDNFSDLFPEGLTPLSILNTRIQQLASFIHLVFSRGI